ncbi:hypothetical protein T4A_10457 [Trichinella pseudospiralis]|uniref:Uncharacterized protein n=1 Tax=Trichinella pseudospiralis TaxID=6337 RepID=A0A0V1EYX6_TRIPS|nr:hypothetical protein T4A_10457 [Trichinella pseudospiralis]
MLFKFRLCQSWRIYITFIFLCSILITVNSMSKNEPLIYTKEKLLTHWYSHLLPRTIARCSTKVSTVQR